MPDALNFVNQGRENTGIAQEFAQSTYNPISASQQYLDKVKMDIQKAKAERQQAELRGRQILSIKPEGWDIDTQKVIVPKLNEMKQTALGYFTKGIDPTDPYKNFEAYQELENRKAEIQNLVNSSKQHMEFYNKQLHTVLNDKEGKIDREAALQRLAEFRGAPSIADRTKMIEGFDLPLAYDIRKDREDIFKGVKATDHGVSVNHLDGDYDEVNISKSANKSELKSRIASALNRKTEKGTKYRQAIMQQGAEWLVQNGKAKQGPDGLLYDAGGNRIPQENITAAGIDQEVRNNNVIENDISIRNRPKEPVSDDSASSISTLSPSTITVGFTSTGGDNKLAREVDASQQFTVKPFKVLSANNKGVVKLDDNEPLDEVGARDVQYGQFAVVPVYKNDASGRRLKGKVVPKSFLDNPKIANNVEYKVMAVGTYDVTTGNSFNKTTEQRYVYRPANDVTGAAVASVPAKDKKILQQRLAEVQAEADRLNSGANKWSKYKR